MKRYSRVFLALIGLFVGSPVIAETENLDLDNNSYAEDVIENYGIERSLNHLDSPLDPVDEFLDLYMGVEEEPEVLLDPDVLYTIYSTADDPIYNDDLQDWVDCIKERGHYGCGMMPVLLE